MVPIKYLVIRRSLIRLSICMGKVAKYLDKRSIIMLKMLKIIKKVFSSEPEGEQQPAVVKVAKVAKVAKPAVAKVVKPAVAKVAKPAVAKVAKPAVAKKTK